MGQTCFVYNKSYNAVTIILTRFNIILIIIAKSRKKQKRPSHFRETALFTFKQNTQKS